MLFIKKNILYRRSSGILRARYSIESRLKLSWFYYSGIRNLAVFPKPAEANWNTLASVC